MKSIVKDFSVSEHFSIFKTEVSPFFFSNKSVYLQLICFIKDFLGFVLSTDVFSKVEMPTHYCLALLELNGIGFSTTAYETQKQVMQAKLSQIETKAYQLAGHSFSLTSPDDIAEVCEGWGGRGRTSPEVTVKRLWLKEVKKSTWEDRMKKRQNANPTLLGVHLSLHSL